MVCVAGWATESYTRVGNRVLYKIRKQIPLSCPDMLEWAADDCRILGNRRLWYGGKQNLPRGRQ